MRPLPPHSHVAFADADLSSFLDAELAVSPRFCSSNGRQPAQTFYSKIMLVNVTAEPVSGVKGWP